jgi:hypothetical protein
MNELYKEIDAAEYDRLAHTDEHFFSNKRMLVIKNILTNTNYDLHSVKFDKEYHWSITLTSKDKIELRRKPIKKFTDNTTIKPRKIIQINHKADDIFIAMITEHMRFVNTYKYYTIDQFDGLVKFIIDITNI